MKHTRKRVITIESRSRTTILRHGNRFHFRCDVCGSEAVSLLPEGADEDQLREVESMLNSGICVDDECRRLLEGETLPKI